MLLLGKDTTVLSSQQEEKKGTQRSGLTIATNSLNNHTSNGVITTTTASTDTSTNGTSNHDNNNNGNSNNNNGFYSTEVGLQPPAIPLSSLQLEDLNHLQSAVLQQEETIHELEDIESILQSLLERRIEEGDKKEKKLGELVQNKQVEIATL